MVECDCLAGEHEFVISEDTYLCLPDGCGQSFQVHYCTSPSCERMSCCASQPGYAAHCCKTCADGLGHSAVCDQYWAWMSLRIRKKVA
jgi:hypothetical protein